MTKGAIRAHRISWCEVELKWTGGIQGGSLKSGPATRGYCQSRRDQRGQEFVTQLRLQILERPSPSSTPVQCSGSLNGRADMCEHAATQPVSGPRLGLQGHTEIVGEYFYESFSARSCVFGSRVPRCSCAILTLKCNAVLITHDCSVGDDVSGGTTLLEAQAPFCSVDWPTFPRGASSSIFFHLDGQSASPPKCLSSWTPGSGGERDLSGPAKGRVSPPDSLQPATDEPLPIHLKPRTPNRTEPQPRAADGHTCCIVLQPGHRDDLRLVTHRGPQFHTHKVPLCPADGHRPDARRVAQPCTFLVNYGAVLTPSPHGGSRGLATMDHTSGSCRTLAVKCLQTQSQSWCHLGASYTILSVLITPRLPQHASSETPVVLHAPQQPIPTIVDHHDVVR